MTFIMEYALTSPLSKADVKKLKAGDTVLLSGNVLTARDAAHRLLYDIIKSDGDLPVPLAGETIYYTGPCPAPPGCPIGSCGPTTSGRMDKYSPALLDLGLVGMIGKGDRSDGVIESMKKNGAVYFAAPGGAGALMARCVETVRVAAFPELGTEAVWLMCVSNMPLTVAIDSIGNNLYRTSYTI